MCMLFVCGCTIYTGSPFSLCRLLVIEEFSQILSIQHRSLREAQRITVLMKPHFIHVG